MKYVRVLFGDKGRREKVEKDIHDALGWKYQFPFVCMTYGLENHEHLQRIGVDSILLSTKPNQYPYQWHHKIYAWKEAGVRFNQFVFLDWDVHLMRELTPELEEDIYADRTFLASLRQYKRVKCTWRAEHQRKTPCASWIYFNSFAVVKDILNTWDRMKRPPKEEAVLSKYCEYNGVFDLNFYLNNYEPQGIFKLKNAGVFKNLTNETIFAHYTGKRRD